MTTVPSGESPPTGGESSGLPPGKREAWWPGPVTAGAGGRRGPGDGGSTRYGQAAGSRLFTLPLRTGISTYGVLMAPCPAVNLPSQGDVHLLVTQSLRTAPGLLFRVGGPLDRWDIQQDQSQ